MNTISETFKTPVVKECDVLVAGGGVAGIAAALAARRQGAKVILVENSCILGGLATSGLVTIYLPLCDGEGHQVSFGISEELLRLSISHFAEADFPSAWLENGSQEKRKQSRFYVRFNAHMFALEAERLLSSEGVEILYNTKICNVQKNSDKVEYIIIENKSGRSAINTASVVDATGDADICHFADAETALYKPQNVLAAWYYYISDGNIDLKPLGCAEIPDDKKIGNEAPPLISRRFSGLDGFDNSEMLTLSHSQMLIDIKKQRKIDSSYVPITIPTIPQLRMTRRIVGEYTLDTKDEHKLFSDSIGLISNWKHRGPIYEVPFRSLYSAKLKNVICAGRCISVTDNMWDVSRVIPCCAVTGEAAGTAATLCDNFSSLDVSKLQTTLEKNSVVIHERELRKN